MKRKDRLKAGRRSMVSLVTALSLTATVLFGCSQQTMEKTENDKVSSENVIITETGEIIEIEGPEAVEGEPAGNTPHPAENVDDPQSLAGAGAEPTASPQIIIPETPVQEPELPEQVVTDAEKMEHDDNKMQLVFLGDSIFDSYRDGTGVPYLTAVQCDANLYNLAIGGTSATLEEGEQMGADQWTSRSLCGVVMAMAKKIPTDIFEGTNAKGILDDPNVDFSKTDYFIVEYGLNDYFRGVPRDGNSHPYDTNYYIGALRFAIINLREIAPDATIVLCSPHYCRFFKGNWMIGDGNVVDNGNGTLYDYKGTCEYVSNEMQTLFLNTYDHLGIDGYTAEEYLEDGVHLTAAGRELYAGALARTIMGYEETKNN